MVPRTEAAPADAGAPTGPGPNPAAAQPAPSKETVELTTGKPSTEADRRSGSGGQPGSNQLVQFLGTVAGKTAFPAALLVMVVIFLGVQDRIDRRDPKLALAPVQSEALAFIDPGNAPIGS